MTTNANANTCTKFGYTPMGADTATVSWEYWGNTASEYLYLLQDVDGRWTANAPWTGAKSYDTPEEAIRADGLDPARYTLPTGWAWGNVEQDHRVVGQYQTREEARVAARAGEGYYAPHPTSVPPSSGRVW